MKQMDKSKYANSFLFLLIAAVLLSGCNQANQNADNTAGAPRGEASAPAPAKASPLSGFARDLQFVRNGQYKFIWIFSRKDGKPIDKDDAAYLRKSAPQVVDWVMTDEGKKAIGGTNFDLEQGNLEQLKKRFVVEDYSGK
jgi:hypothetical protein